MSIQNKIKSLVYFLALIFVACSTGHCRRDGSGQVLQQVDAKPPAGYEQEDLGHLTVSKPDGSLQCQARPGIPLDEMAKKELVGVKILSSEKKSDGLMRIQSCGSATGMLNTYTIRHQDLRTAQKAGFTLVKETKSK